MKPPRPVRSTPRFPAPPRRVIRMSSLTPVVIRPWGLVLRRPDKLIQVWLQDDRTDLPRAAAAQRLNYLVGLPGAARRVHLFPFLVGGAAALACLVAPLFGLPVLVGLVSAPVNAIVLYKVAARLLHQASQGGVVVPNGDPLALLLDLEAHHPILSGLIRRAVEDRSNQQGILTMARRIVAIEKLTAGTAQHPEFTAALTELVANSRRSPEDFTASFHAVAQLEADAARLVAAYAELDAAVVMPVTPESRAQAAIHAVRESVDLEVGARQDVAAEFLHPYRWPPA